MVQPQHRFSKDQTVNQFMSLLAMENEIKDPKDELKSIARKITIWKRNHSEDIDEQAEFVNVRLRKQAGQNIKVQNLATVVSKLHELEDIGLTDVERALLIYTSMMDEELNNLIISNTKFMHWFTIDFADDTQEEDDFMQNRWEAYYYAIKAAKLIAAELQSNP
jgi:hypothetical protein